MSSYRILNTNYGAKAGRLQRATTQPLRLLKIFSPEEIQKEKQGTNNSKINNSQSLIIGLYDILGSTGSVYRVSIGTYFTCSCPDNMTRHNQCKHILFILHRYLKIPIENEITSSDKSRFSEEELTILFSFLSEHQRKQSQKELEATKFIQEQYQKKVLHKNSNLKEQKEEKEIPKVIQRSLEEEGEDCVICLELMNPKDTSNPLIWCQKVCGKTIHKICLIKWTEAKLSQKNYSQQEEKDSQVKCPLCKGEWIEEDLPAHLQKNKKHKIDNVSSPFSSSPYINLLD